jgi:hypothetical protein
VPCIDDPRRTGLLIVRLWAEGDLETDVRARITTTRGTSGSEEAVAVAATADEICTVVRAWVDGFAVPPSKPTG